jgi:hypothetical protein
MDRFDLMPNVSWCRDNVPERHDGNMLVALGFASWYPVVADEVIQHGTTFFGHARVNRFIGAVFVDERFPFAVAGRGLQVTSLFNNSGSPD